MAQNKLSHLNDHLFAQLERLGDETIEPEKMDLEIKKSKAIGQLAAQVIKNASLMLSAAKMVSQGELTTDDAQNVKQKLLS